MSYVDLAGRAYKGLDVVDEVLAANRIRYGKPGIDFFNTPNDLSSLPPADLFIIKDVMIHITNNNIENIIKQFFKYKYILSVNNTCDATHTYNVPINLGEFRPVDLRLFPFSLKCATVLTYGSPKMPDPNLPLPLAVALKRFIWPGKKHVQLLINS